MARWGIICSVFLLQLIAIAWINWLEVFEKWKYHIVTFLCVLKLNTTIEHYYLYQQYDC